MQRRAGDGLLFPQGKHLRKATMQFERRENTHTHVRLTHTHIQSSNVGVCEPKKKQRAKTADERSAQMKTDNLSAYVARADVLCKKKKKKKKREKTNIQI